MSDWRSSSISAAVCRSLKPSSTTSVKPASRTANNGRGCAINQSKIASEQASLSTCALDYITVSNQQMATAMVGRRNTTNTWVTQFHSSSFQKPLNSMAKHLTRCFFRHETVKETKVSVH